MRALLTPEIAPRSGVVLFRPGPELMPLFQQSRVLIGAVPENLMATPTGLVPAAHQSLTDDQSLATFFANEAVLTATEGAGALKQVLMHGDNCQWPASDYHHREITCCMTPQGAVRLCWHCDNQLRETEHPELLKIAGSNRNAWIIERVRIDLGFQPEHAVTVPELCWWAVVNNVTEALPENVARKALRWPSIEVVTGPFKESDIVPVVAATDVISQKMQKLSRPAPADVSHETQPKILKLVADVEASGTFLLRPKCQRWESKKYTGWVKTRPCCGCGRPADYPHHIIGHGMGGTATKAHDLFVIPLCRECHDKLHADVAAFEREYGTQLELLLRFPNWALAIGVIVKE